jgi:transketolase
MPSPLDCANAIRALSMDAVEQANSGHPGMPMGMADIAETLWNEFLVHNPQNPDWPNRDRFILSNGHGSMLHYSLLHLTGYDLSIDDLKAFRQLHSKTPGHPEFGMTPGIETTTGPLGQGLSNAVGMALAEKILAAHYNRPDHELIDHHTYVFTGDGCLMEGISHEACSLAGTLKLGKLIAFYDDNGISIDGKVAGWFTDNTPQRFEAYGWHVVEAVDGHDRAAIEAAVAKARSVTDKPSIICCKTNIAHGAPNLAGSHESHGAPLGTAEVAATRKQLAWSHAPFDIPDEIYAAWDAREKGQAADDTWQQQFAAYQQAYPELAEELSRRLKGDLPADCEEKMQAFIQTCIREEESIATRKASLKTLNAIADNFPELIGGSADLSGSNLTFHQHSKGITPEDIDGNYIYYGVREFGMSAIMNGLALHGGFIPYGGTFLVFLDYARNAVRLSALMRQQVIYVFTHDSIGLGEDGPTHQPVEHAAMLRATPNMSVWRPCDTVETAVAWQAAITHRDGPTALLLSRQTLPHQERSDAAATQIARGGYILKDCAQTPEVILIATGSEVALAVAAYEQLSAAGKQVRVVSMPSCDVFNAQDAAYQESVLPRAVSNRVAIEAGASMSWYQYVGTEGRVIGLDRFGDSAPGKTVFTECGFTVDNIINTVDTLIATGN